MSDAPLGGGLNPIDGGELYDKILLAGVYSPGKATISGHKRAFKWDIKDGDGQSGATSTFKGEKVAQFIVSFELVLDPVLGIDDFAEWDAFLPILEKGANGKEALLIFHPDLVSLRIDCVTVESIGGFIHDGMGGAKVEVAFIGYAPPKKKTGTPKPKGNDPNADLKKQIDDLLNEAKKP